MPSVFISYRRSDSPDTVKLLHERLKKRLPRWAIFYDHESIPLGEKFPELLRAEVTSATAVLVIIGPRWLELLHKRRGGPIDHVREEVRLALEAGSNVVPVLVGNAVMPAHSDLADFADLQPLLQLNGRPIRPDPDFDADVEPIIAFLRQLDCDEAIGATLADKYTLTCEIGAGGMGVVYAAQQKQPVQRIVAVKLIKPGMDSRDVLARFDAERQALAVMDHPNIAKVLDAGLAASGRPFFVMEYVKGAPITQYCDDKKLTPQERLGLFIPVCNAVQHAHQKGIIHRDLKPSNVLVEVIDGKPAPKVIDFGLAKALGHKLTEKTLHTALDMRVGTLEYSAPEQAAGHSFDVDTRSDIYSLGVLLYELLTGAPPFTHEELLKVGEEEMRRVIREVEPATPSKKLSSSGELPAIAAKRNLEPAKLTRTVYGDLDWIVMKCLEKEQGRRYETANQLGEELQRFLKDEPVQAGPPSVTYRARKFLRRNRGPVIAAMLVLLALVGGIVATSIGLVIAERARQAEAEQRELAQASERKAEQAAKAERTSRDAAEKASYLLADIFTDLNPVTEKKGGANLLEQLTRRLDDVARRIDEGAISDPKAVARLQTLLGHTLVQLGNPKRAIEILSKAGATRAGLLGPEHADSLTTMEKLVEAYAVDGQLAKALQLGEETLAKRKASLGPDHPDTLTSMENLGVFYSIHEQWAKAFPLLEDALAKRKTTLGPHHSDTLSSMNSLAGAYRRAGQLAKALPLLEETLAKSKAHLGLDHIGTLATMNDLAGAYAQDRQLAKALPLYEETLAKRKAKFGPDHRATLESMNDLAVAYLADGQLPRAVPLLEETLARAKAKLGLDHPDTLISMDNLARVYRADGQLAKASSLYKEMAQRKGNTPAQGTIEWLTYSSPEPKCSIMFPGKPTAKGDKNDTEVILEALEGDYQFRFNDMPHDLIDNKEGVKTVFDAGRDAVTKSFKNSKILKDVDTTIHGYPARELDAEAPGFGLYRARFVLTSRHFYQIVTLGPKEFVESVGARKFRESFKVKERALEKPPEEPKTWVTYSSIEAECAIMFPDKVTAKGDKKDTQVTLEASRGTATYLFSFNDMPADLTGNKELTKTVFNAGRDAVVKSFKNGKILKEADSAVHGYPARDFDADVPGLGIYRARLVLTSRYFYQIVTFGPKEFVEGASAHKFRESFKVKNRAP